jgi:1-acyl-sn-glycerol-3-phosphate acyltransferase
MKKPGTVRVVIGPPIEAGGRDVREINRQVQEWIEDTVARLQGRGRAPPAASEGLTHQST